MSGTADRAEQATGQSCRGRGRGRHWFTRYGRVGERTDRCVRCGAPNPKLNPPPGRALFVPLATAAYRRFESGDKTVELRQSSKRWNPRNVSTGRAIVLRRGYSTKDEIRGKVGRVAVATDFWALPEWAIAGSAVVQGDLIASDYVDPHRPLIAFEVLR